MRIASLSPATTEILFALGCKDLIVCRDQFSNFPEETSAIPKLMGHDKVDPEELKKFAPDVVFTETVVQEKLSVLLRQNGFSVIHRDHRTLHQIYDGIRSLGTIVSKEPEAEQLILRTQRGFNDAKRKARLLPKKPRVYVEEWHQPPFASGNWVPEIVRTAGGLPYPIRDGELSKEVSLADVTAFNPDLVVISWCGAGTLGDPELLTRRPGWDALFAVQQKNVRVIDDAFLNRPGPRLVEGAQRLYGWLFEMLH